MNNTENELRTAFLRAALDEINPAELARKADAHSRACARAGEQWLGEHGLREGVGG